MSAVLSGSKAGGGLAHLFASWKSLRRRELALFALAGALGGLIDLASLLELGVDDKLLPIVTRLVLPILACLILLLAWLPAARSDRTHPQRVARLALATLIGTALANLILTPLVHLLPWPTIGELMRAKKGLPPVNDMTVFSLLGGTLGDFMPMALMVAVIELLGRRRRSEESVQRMLTEHSQLRRHAMAARLAALQAQVEPQLLFDALVDIEQAYARADEAAPARMEQLIRHLRVALPRLRETGVTRLDAEIELLESYLAVLQGLGHPPLAFVDAVPPALRGAGLPPMLLLPLLQRALKLGVSAATCTLGARAETGRLQVTLAFDRPGLCTDDDELRALAERLRVLSNGPARLRCEGDAGASRFILELPAA